MSVVLLARDLLFGSHIESAATRAGTPLRVVPTPDELPPAELTALLLVDWGDRGAGWGERIAAWRMGAAGGAQPRVVLFGPHTDLEAHAAAKQFGLGPMRARSRLLGELDALLGSANGLDRP